MKRLFNNSLLLFFLFTLSATPQNLQYNDESWKIYDDSEVALIEITVDPAAIEYMYNNVRSDSLHLSTIRFKNAYIDETVDSVGLRLRGNTSRDAKKKSFKLSFNTFKPGGNFYGLDKINLNGEHNDPSIIRAKLCWDLFKDIGMTASRAAHAAVFINGEYYGLYISVEHVDDEFIKRNYRDFSGNLWKCLYPADLAYLGDNPDNYKLYSGDRQPYDLITNEESDDYTQLARLIKIINLTPNNLFADSLESILSIREALKYFALNILVGGWDDYWFLKNNYYLYYEPEKDLFHWIPYDYDNTFGIDWFNVDWANINPYLFSNIDGSPRPFIERVIANPQYRNLFSHFLIFYRDKVYSLPIWDSRIDNLKNLITGKVLSDYYRTLDYGFTFNDFLNSYSEDSYSNQHVKRGIKEFVNKRNDALYGQINFVTAVPIVYNIDWAPKNPGPEDTITVNISAFSHPGLEAVSVQYHPGSSIVIETYPMEFSPVSSTKLVEEADKWNGKIPPLGITGGGYFQILATDINGTSQLYPRKGGIEIKVPSAVTSKIVINEFMAKNDSYIADDAGEFDDWIELYNPTQDDIFLSEKYLTDDPASLTKWQFPFGGVIIGAGEYMIVWCDKDDNQSGLHADFQLDAAGEFIGLVAEDGVTIIDSISFGTQTPDISFGRYPDASENWEFLDPTAGSANIITRFDAGYQPEKFSVSVFPNPFNPSTTIQYQLPFLSDLSIKIYDLLGREVWRHRELSKSPGKYSLQWATKDNRGKLVSSGIYLLRIEVGKLNKTVKLILLK